MGNVFSFIMSYFRFNYCSNLRIVKTFFLSYFDDGSQDHGPKSLKEWVGEITPESKPSALEKVNRQVRFDADKNRVNEFKKFRKDFIEGNEVPDSLLGWVVISPSKLPELIEEKFIADNWLDHPELEELLTGYIDNHLKKWSERVQKYYKANFPYSSNTSI